jgi:hypothetical protein
MEGDGPMSMKAVLVVTLVTATGDLAQPPQILPQEEIGQCNAAAKATVEALALAMEERALPARVPGSPVAAAQQGNTGVWLARYKRQKRPDEKDDPEVTARMVRAACRPVG